jgi:hypothetical protein
VNAGGPAFTGSCEMKTQDRITNKPGSHLEYRKTSTEALDFHANRIRRELKIENRKESPIQPAGNDEYEQLIAEDASFNTKPMIEEAAFFLAEQRGFAPGKELSDWLQAESKVETLLCKTVAIERRNGTNDDRRKGKILVG